MSAHTNVFLHFSVCNSFWLCNGDPPLEYLSSHDQSCFAPSPTTAMAPSFYPSSVTSCSSQKTSRSEVDLLPIGPLSQRTPPSPSTTGLTLKTAEGCRHSTLRLRILDPQKSTPSEDRHGVSSSLASQHSSRQGGRSDYNLWKLGWRGLKKSRSKTRRARMAQQAEYSDSLQMSAIRRCRSRCSTNRGNTRREISAISRIDKSSYIVEVSSSNCQPDRPSESSDRVSSNGRRTGAGTAEPTTKLDQLALLACELKGKRTRSPRNYHIRRHYTPATFFPLGLISAYWQQNSSSEDVTGPPINDSLSVAPVRDMSSMKLSAKAAAHNYEDRTGDFLGAATLKIKKAKHFGRQTRVQRCAMRVLELVGKDIIREKLIRQALGNNPDTSKALRLLLDQRKLGRIGAGGRKDPYKYKVTPYGLLELSH